MNENKWISKWTKDQIVAMLLEQHQGFWQRDTGIERTLLGEIERLVPLPHAIVISGLRRSGKSTLLAQFAHRLGEEHFYFVNFEDDRFLGFRAEDADDLYRYLVEIFGERKIFLVDEIQNVPGWEHFVRRMMDQGLKFVITGSNASLLSRELGTHLTGRYIPIELFPFSFKEFLRFNRFPLNNPARMTTIESAQLLQKFDQYLRLGGLPEHLRYPELPLLRTLYDDILYRDIAARYRIEEVRALKELAYYLMSNPAGYVSFNKLKERLSLGSVNTIKNYIEYMENSWLIFTVNVFDYSVKRQQIAAKKVYSIDTGLTHSIGFSFSANTVKLMENAAFLSLRRKTHEVYYLTTPAGYEVDFYLPESGQLIQVVQNINNHSTRERELRALLDARHLVGGSLGLILTDANSDPISVNGFTILIRSLAEWLLETE